MTATPMVRYDPEADAIGLYFAPEGSHYVESAEVAPGLVLDYDAEGRVIGAQVLFVSQLRARSGGMTPAANRVMDAHAAE